ncbi:MAG: acyltransferase [Lysobacteraceae bacterium SCN 69-123]|jgi:predicted LPLAT superfamily acyltransferase|uniref:LpxL/LpxP family acyltransferase n=1 Tax=Stenotrophomonas acidaminiphila TaxID=128780 RepID=UPI0008694363|nr:acyltransferase [Stenotrophomonas acidaminiphila]MBN8800284.1 acyltransferase [Stenotrophomonas acidaminiphila]MDF9440546.1 acyltransferase [Stenotrophomonas acidaminiphila]ODU46983.1 MAG: acyltransferase [Xanthomonadaceae bacterium SCN 69-123]OJY72770.1 MAG: acyltransferase [Stenotrophomonas sp. 69-14]
MSDADWKRRPEGGGRAAIRLIAAIARHGGRGVARLCLYPITGYFLLVRASERRASRAYLGRVLGRRARLRDVARHIHTFAATILDRVFLLGGRMDLFDIRTEGTGELLARLDEGRGVLLFGSHLGSFDALRALGRQRPDLKLRVLLDRGHNAAITELLAELDPGLAAGIIDAGQGGPAVVLAIQQALQEGAMVALLVDRARPGETALAAPLLGAPAPFPTAPWLIASVLKAPVMLAFGLYRGGNRYDLLFEPFATAVDVPRAQRAEALSALVHRYAGRLEHHLRGAPWNWFNFYDFWHSQASLPAPPDGSGAAGRLDQRAGDGGRR